VIRTLVMRGRGVLSLAALLLASCGGGGTGDSGTGTVAILDADFALIVGETRQLTASVFSGPGSVAWRSTAPDVATISATGVATGVAVGDARLIASLGRSADTVNVRILPGGIVSLRLTAPKTLLKVSDTIRVVAEPLDGQGRVLQAPAPTWASSDSSRARVTPFGLVLGVGAPGNVTISATVGGVTGTLAFTTATAAVGRVEVVPDSALLAPGSTVAFQAAVFDEFGGRDTTRAVTWSLFPEAPTGSIDATGRFTALLDGRVTVRATAAGVTGTAEVEVNQIAASRFRIEVTNFLYYPVEVIQNGVSVGVIPGRSVGVVERPLTPSLVLGWALVRPSGKGESISETKAPIANPTGTITLVVDNVLDDGRVLFTPLIRNFSGVKPVLDVQPRTESACRCTISPEVPVNDRFGYWVLSPSSLLLIFAQDDFSGQNPPRMTIPVPASALEANTGIFSYDLLSVP
jgi:hypothetical protein